ncbi:MAG: hypothetical protein Q8M22_10335 [Actinomycetota bacterium]|nr:hypothetical protein [Actinomycetota bacterium]
MTTTELTIEERDTIARQEQEARRAAHIAAARAEYERVQESEPLPTADEVAQMFDRFALALYAIKQHVETLGFPVSCGEMREEGERVQQLIWQIVRDVATISSGHCCGDNSVPAAMALVESLTDASGFGCNMDEPRRMGVGWPTPY